ncbi:glycine oxidase ThiO [Corynebacterium glyciniphilum]|uniref:glycine oxidase ThiO n=1 Tax=Corynebacterium glyciniphilum TaxID=1404244 RepID=UPI00265435EF|nr:glycine oxidase ThiO [Corynebacterium glyciniphilum]MDN5682790.1 glycine oxidase ThiO [Corynebacterium glyciniphilum]MDN6705579.1 glycine oxidase ThiO [Corynebacterium glyciniphilum]
MPETLVVGAGITGLSSAWCLRRAGHTVNVIDPDPGNGASHAAAGMIAAVSEVVHQHDAIRPLMLASAGEYPQFIADLERTVGHSVGYLQTATLGVGATPGDVAAFRDLSDVQRAAGMSVERLTVRQARRLEPSLAPGISGAFLVADDHQVNPRSLLEALAEAVYAPSGTGGPQGRLIRERVAAVLRQGDTATGVRLADGREVRADATVLCPGVSFPAIDGLPEARAVRLRPVHGDILRARVKPGHPALLERTVRGLVDGRPVYLVPRADGEIVIGATEREDGFDGVSLEGVHQLLRDAQILVPGAADLELTEILARARPGTPDDLPYLGGVPGADGVTVSTGYSRHGVLLAPLCARLAAVLASGEAPPGPHDTTLLTTTSLERTP